jgi:hypothetical protein
VARIPSEVQRLIAASEANVNNLAVRGAVEVQPLSIVVN